MLCIEMEDISFGRLEKHSHRVTSNEQKDFVCDVLGYAAADTVCLLPVRSYQPGVAVAFRTLKAGDLHAREPISPYDVPPRNWLGSYVCSQ